MSQIARGRYIESFDSVRFSSQAEPLDLPNRKAHAEVELMLSVLFGEPMIVPEPFSFDSLGFLEIASHVIESRPKELVNTSVYYPFRLAFREAKGTFRSMVSTLFNREGFILSGWPEIDKDTKVRVNIAECIEKGDFRKALQITSIESIHQKIELLEYLDNYFSAAPNCHAGKADTPLPEYIDWLIESNVEALQKAYPGHEKDIRMLQDACAELKREGVEWGNRGMVRELGERILGDQKLLSGVIEYTDSCYNRVVASSVGVEVDRYTSVFTTQKNAIIPEVFAAEQLPQLFTSERSARKWNEVYLAISLDGAIETTFNPIAWTDIWEIVSNEQWIKSVQTLHAALTATSDNIIEAAEEAYDAHVNLLTKLLSPSIAKIRIENNTIQIKRQITSNIVGKVAEKLLEYGLGIPSGAGSDLLFEIATERIMSVKGKWSVSGTVNAQIHEAVRLG